MRSILILLGICILYPLQAQDVVGKIVDSNDQPVCYANIIMIAADSSYIVGTVSDMEGRFRLLFSDNMAFLRVSYIGYHDAVVPVIVGKHDLGEIKLRENTQLLDEVVVKGSLPKTRMKGDALLTTVAGSLLENMGTALDVLAKVPGLTLKGEDIDVFGRGTPLVYINGREVKDPSELAQLTSDNIQSVEVVRNPGVRYDKTVKAVVRIRTKKRGDDGFGFSDRANVNYNNKWSYLNQLNLYYRRKKMDLTGMIFYSDQSSKRGVNAKQRTCLENNWLQDMSTKQQFFTRQWIGDIALNYIFNPEHSLGMSYRYNHQPESVNNMFLTTRIDRDGSFFENSRGNVYCDSPGTRHEGNVYYSGKIHQWSIDANATWIRTTEDAKVQTDETVENKKDGVSLSAVHSFADTKNLVYAGKLDLSYSIWDGTFSFGGEYTHISRSSLYDNVEGIIADDDSQIHEGLIAAFAEYKRTFGRVDIQVGLRFENVNFDYYQKGIFQEPQSRNYNNLFPVLSVFIPINDLQLQMSYGSYIARPNYQSLRNRIDYVNRYTYESGNPFLSPAITNIATLNLIYKWVQFSADYQHRKDGFIPSSKPYSDEEPNIALMSLENAPAYDVISLMANFSPTFGCWSPQLNLEMGKQWYKVDKPETTLDMPNLNMPSFAIRWKNGLDLPLGFVWNADVNWEGRTAQSNTSYKSVWWVNTSLYKGVMNDKLTFLLQVSDLFDTYRNNYFMYYGSLRTMEMEENPNFRSVSLTIRYKFNTKKNKYKGSGAGQDVINRL